MKRYTYGVTEQGKRLGEAHQNAKLSDADVEKIRDMHEEGMISYSRLAKLFGVHKSTISDICTYRKRSTTPHGFKTVKEQDMKRKPPKSRFLDEDPMLQDIEEDVLDLDDVLGVPRGRSERMIEDLD